MNIPVIGLVGGVGSGKSSVAKGLAARRPCDLLDADSVGHAVLRNAEVKQRLRERFGDGVFSEEGEVLRPALGKLVFGTEPEFVRNRADLETIVHPYIKKELVDRLTRAKAEQRVQAILLDAALLLEAGWRTLCDFVVFVDVPEAVRLRRVIERRGWSEPQFRAREASQWPLSQKRAAAQYVIDNGESLETAVSQLEEILEQHRH